MKKILKNEMNRIKLEIKNRYLAGEPVPSIALSMGVVPRTIYFHLGELKSREKGMHAQNSSLRKDAVLPTETEINYSKEQNGQPITPRDNPITSGSRVAAAASDPIFPTPSAMDDFISGRDQI